MVFLGIILCILNFITLSNIAYAADTDGDGIDELVDLDDDNDGILDFDEECMGFIAQNTTGAWKGDTLSNATVTYFI